MRNDVRVVAAVLLRASVVYSQYVYNIPPCITSLARHYVESGDDVYRYDNTCWKTDYQGVIPLGRGGGSTSSCQRRFVSHPHKALRRRCSCNDDALNNDCAVTGAAVRQLPPPGRICRQRSLS